MGAPANIRTGVRVTNVLVPVGGGVGVMRYCESTNIRIRVRVLIGAINVVMCMGMAEIRTLFSVLAPAMIRTGVRGTNVLIPGIGLYGHPDPTNIRIGVGVFMGDGGRIRSVGPAKIRTGHLVIGRPESGSSIRCHVPSTVEENRVGWVVTRAMIRLRVQAPVLCVGVGNDVKIMFMGVVQDGSDRLCRVMYIILSDIADGFRFHRLPVVVAPDLFRFEVETVDALTNREKQSRWGCNAHNVDIMNVWVILALKF